MGQMKGHVPVVITALEEQIADATGQMKGHVPIVITALQEQIADAVQQTGLK